MFPLNLLLIHKGTDTREHLFPSSIPTQTAILKYPIFRWRCRIGENETDWVWYTEIKEEKRNSGHNLLCVGFQMISIFYESAFDQWMQVGVRSMYKRQDHIHSHNLLVAWHPIWASFAIALALSLSLPPSSPSHSVHIALLRYCSCSCLFFFLCSSNTMLKQWLNMALFIYAGSLFTFRWRVHRYPYKR